MLWLYLSALVFGFGMFAVQMLFSSDSGADADTDAAAELGAEGNAELHESAGDAEAHPHGSSPVGDWASIFLSLRFYMFAAMGLGGVGAPATWLELASPLGTLLAASVTALFVGVVGAWAFRALGRQTLSAGASHRDLVGQIGRVLLPCEKGRRGKVRVRVRGQLVDYLATTEETRLEAGTAVVVQEVGSHSVVVCEAPRELLPELGRGEEA